MGFPSYMGDPSMGRVHRFMALDSAEVGYFISQVGAAATCFGVASSDVSAVAGVLMQYFGYRCSPPLAITGGAELQSICEDCSCPYDPYAQCQLYPDGGCEPGPMTASQCMSAPTGYMSSTYSSMKYQPTYSSKYEKPSSMYEKSKTSKYESKTYSSEYNKPTYTSEYKTKTKTSEYEHKTSSKEYKTSSTWGESSKYTSPSYEWGYESSASSSGYYPKY